MSDMKKEDKTEHINLKVVGQDGHVVHFKIKKHTQLKKLINAYCEKSKIVASTVRFRFDGSPINDTDTPTLLEMEDGDSIEVFQPQTGGRSQRCQISSSSKVNSINISIKNFSVDALQRQRFRSNKSVASASNIVFNSNKYLNLNFEWKELRLHD